MLPTQEELLPYIQRIITFVKSLPPLQLAENTIIQRLSELIVNAINFYLSEKDEQLSSTSITSKLTSLDDIDIANNFDTKYKLVDELF